MFSYLPILVSCWFNHINGEIEQNLIRTDFLRNNVIALVSDSNCEAQSQEKSFEFVDKQASIIKTSKMNPIQIAESLQILHVNANNSVTPCIRTSTKLWRNI